MVKLESKKLNSNVVIENRTIGSQQYQVVVFVPVFDNIQHVSKLFTFTEQLDCARPLTSKRYEYMARGFSEDFLNLKQYKVDFLK